MMYFARPPGSRPARPIPLLARRRPVTVPTWMRQRSDLDALRPLLNQPRHAARPALTAEWLLPPWWMLAGFVALAAVAMLFAASTDAHPGFVAVYAALFVASLAGLCSYARRGAS